MYVYHLILLSAVIFRVVPSSFKLYSVVVVERSKYHVYSYVYRLILSSVIVRVVLGSFKLCSVVVVVKIYIKLNAKITTLKEK